MVFHKQLRMDRNELLLNSKNTVATVTAIPANAEKFYTKNQKGMMRFAPNQLSKHVGPIMNASSTIRDRTSVVECVWRGRRHAS